MSSSTVPAVMSPRSTTCLCRSENPGRSGRGGWGRRSGRRPSRFWPWPSPPNSCRWPQSRRCSRSTRARSRANGTTKRWPCGSPTRRRTTAAGLHARLSCYTRVTRSSRVSPARCRRCRLVRPCTWPIRRSTSASSASTSRSARSSPSPGWSSWPTAASATCRRRMPSARTAAGTRCGWR